MHKSLWLLMIVLALVGIYSVHQSYVLDSATLIRDIDRELPSGSSKSKVVDFIRTKHPMFVDDIGGEVKARLHGLAGNLVYEKNILLHFEFDSQGQLVSHSMKTVLTFL